MFYFHGTHIDNVASILKQGLDPQCSGCADDEPDKKKFTFLSHCVWGAHRFAPGGVYCKDKSIDNRAILVITPPRSLIYKFNFRRGEFVRVPVVIPPAYIRLLPFKTAQSFIESECHTRGLRVGE